MLIRVASASLVNRRTTALLTILSIAVSVAILLGVEHIRGQARSSFASTVSGVDLIVGGRTSQVNLLLYSVFRIGNATNNISWQSYRELAADPAVAWTVPISLGDSHRGYRVMGTTTGYFEHFRYGNRNSLEFREGTRFDDVYDAVLGSEAARELGYRTGDSIVLAHGLGQTSFVDHADKPFTVVGVLAPTGTPVDQTVHVPLEGIEAIHIDWQQGVRLPGLNVSADQAMTMDLTPETITAFLVGLDNRIAAFGFQRKVNEYRAEPLSAILPGVALTELWSMMGMVENLLRLIAALVLVASLLGMTTMLLASMRERDREIAVLRAVGAHPSFILLAVELEALFLAATGLVAGWASLALALAIGRGWLVDRYGLHIDLLPWSGSLPLYAALILAGAALMALIPAVIAYRRSLQSGLSVRT